MFPESPAAEYFQMTPGKVSYVVKFGIASFFKQLLKEKISESKCSVVSFDESCNGFTQTCQGDLVTRYWWPLFAGETSIAEMKKKQAVSNEQIDLFRNSAGAILTSDCGYKVVQKESSWVHNCLKCSFIWSKKYDNIFSRTNTEAV